MVRVISEICGAAARAHSAIAYKVCCTDCFDGTQMLSAEIDELTCEGKRTGASAKDTSSQREGWYREAIAGFRQGRERVVNIPFECGAGCLH